jgi:hypothetical protein
MYRWLAVAVVGLAVTATAFWSFRGGGRGAAAGSCRVEEHGGITVVRISGPPRNRGRALGAALRQRIRQELERALPADPGVRDFVLESAGERLQGFLPAAYREEIEGIAEGAQISFEEALLLDTRYELKAHHLAREEGDLAGEGAVGPGPEAGRLFVTATVSDLVVVIHEDRVPPLALLARPGMTGGFLGVSGNVAAVARPAPSETPPDLGGLVWTLLLRRLVEAPRDPPPEATGRLKVAMARPDGTAGTLSLDVSGATWHAAEEPASILGNPPPPGQTLVSLRAGSGLLLVVAGPGGRREFRLGPPAPP